MLGPLTQKHRPLHQAIDDDSRSRSNQPTTMAKGDTSRANKRKFGSGKGSPYAALPRRGPPAIFVTCESGRENKCKREALELLHHYYYLSREDGNTTFQQTAASSDQIADQSSPITAEHHDIDESNSLDGQQKQPLSLEEELSLLRKGVMAEEVLTYERNPKSHKGVNDSNGAGKSSNKKLLSSMKSPFSIYESGVRGMICVLCNLKGSEMIPYDDIVAKVKSTKDEEATSFANNDETEDNQVVCKSIEKEDENSDEEDSPSYMQTVLWDPVDTVRCIIEGVIKECSPNATSELLSSAPSSRFITRMIPMQATVSYLFCIPISNSYNCFGMSSHTHYLYFVKRKCYASVDEIKLVTKSLLQRYLSSRIQKSETIPASTNNISFKVDMKRRLCSHLTRDQVIDAITPIVLGCSDTAEEEGGEVDGTQKKNGCATFSVNLSDPDFAIRIEIVKTLCGISILPREQWYKNFNIAELIDSKDNDKKD